MQAEIDEARELLTEWRNNITGAKLFFNTREILGADYQSRATGVRRGFTLRVYVKRAKQAPRTGHLFARPTICRALGGGAGAGEVE
jgi:hypothetical protein